LATGNLNNSMSTTGWDKFWIDQKKSFNEVMRIGTTYFGKKVEDKFSIKPGDKILDYGCGPGFLADYFATKNILITGADINSIFLDQCKLNHPNSKFILITTSAEENKEIFETQITGQKFDFIILMSIVQYFKSYEDVEDALNLLLVNLKQDGKIIIADVLDGNTSSIRDALSLFFHCLKENKIGAFIRFIIYILSSDYRSLSSKLRLLHLSEESVKRMSSALDLNYQKVERLTIHASRTNYVLTKK
jgi:2-polyprenyl-3-methyl-5-hydroxy-6-metoxy-1,4-benzoquinol methylase